MNTEKLAQTAIEKGISTVVVLTGDAPKQHNNNPVTIKGNVDAPARFIEGRKADFNESARHAMVSKTDGEITLVLNEQSTVDKYTIVGKIEIAKKFKALKINDDKGSYTPEELANKFKLLRSLFESNLEHSKICTTLRNLKATVNKQIEDADDRKGNVTKNFQQTVESNMPDAITLNIPLLEGEEPTRIEVNVILEASNGGIVCYLESVEAAEMIETQFAERVQQEIDKIKDFVTVIEY